MINLPPRRFKITPTVHGTQISEWHFTVCSVFTASAIPDCGTDCSRLIDCVVDPYMVSADGASENSAIIIIIISI